MTTAPDYPAPISKYGILSLADAAEHIAPFFDGLPPGTYTSASLYQSYLASGAPVCSAKLFGMAARAAGLRRGRTAESRLLIKSAPVYLDIRIPVPTRQTSVSEDA